MQKRIYLASPYSSPEQQVREARFNAACEAAARIMAQGDLVFSPIAHSHVLAEKYQLPMDFDYWQAWCLSFLRHWATHFVILEIPGWETSIGVRAERILAADLGLPLIPACALLRQA